MNLTSVECVNYGCDYCFDERCTKQLISIGCDGACTSQEEQP